MYINVRCDFLNPYKMNKKIYPKVNVTHVKEHVDRVCVIIDTWVPIERAGLNFLVFYAKHHYITPEHSSQLENMSENIATRLKQIIEPVFIEVEEIKKKYVITQQALEDKVLVLYDPGEAG